MPKSKRKEKTRKKNYGCSKFHRAMSGVFAALLLLSLVAVTIVALTGAKQVDEKDIYCHYIDEICAGYGNVDPNVIKAQVFYESCFHPRARNQSTVGLLQIDPRWNRDRMEKLGVTDLYDPYSNLLVGIDLMSEYLQEYNSYGFALMAYNGGVDYAGKLYFSGRLSTYAENILDLALELSRR